MKLYRTRTQIEYDWLMWKLEKKGKVSFIPLREQGNEIVVYVDEEEDYLTYSDLDYAEEECPNEPIINVSDLMVDTLADKVIERNNKKSIQDRLPEELENLLADEPHDPIQPAHYRKGEIDLFESWYRTYPFNEFRAGMQMIAERYMKRDKHDRVEDVEKSIETLTRLKEYEELEE